MFKRLFSCCAAQTDNNTVDLSKPQGSQAGAPIKHDLLPESKIDGLAINFEIDDSQS